MPLHEHSHLRFANKIGALLVLTFLVVAVGSSPAELSANILPEISRIPDATIGVSSVLTTVPFAVSDPETPADKLSLTGSSSDTALVPNANIVFGGTGASRNVTITPVPQISGATTITISVNDESGGKATVNFLLTVMRARRAPTLDSLPDLKITRDAPAQTVNLTGISLGVFKEGQTLKVTAVSSNPALIADPMVNYVSPNSSGTLSFGPAAGVDGQATITVTVDDGSASDSTVRRSFVVTVLAPNVPPDVSGIPDQTVDVNNVLTAVPFHVADSETPADQLSITGSSSDPTLVPNGNILFNGSGSGRTITVIPAPNQFGATIITISVKDENGDRATASFLLTVAPPGRAPTLDPLPNLTINEDAPAQMVTLTGIAPGVFKQSQILKVTAVSSNPTVIPDPVVNYTSPNNSGTLGIAPVPHAHGIAIITVTIDDGNPIDPTISRSFNVTVFPVNDVPTVSAILDQAIDENTIAAFIPFDVADVETSVIDLVVSGFSADTTLVPNANIVFVGSGANRTLLVTPAPNRFGTTKLTINVADSDGGVGASAFLLTVRPVNTPPFISSVAAQFTLQDQTTPPIAVTVGDVETEASELKLTASSSNTTLAPNENFIFAGTAADRSLVIIPAAGQTGTTTITLTVSDGIATTSETFDLTVTAAPPNIITQPISQSVMPGETVTFSVEATGSGPLSYQWRLNGSDIPGARESKLVLSEVTISQVGNYSVGVSNAVGSISSQIASLNIAAPPTISIQPRSQIVETGSPLSLDVSTIGDGPFIYQWRLNGVNIPGATNATFTVPNVQPADAGTYSCAVANQYGAVNSAIAPIIAQVNDLPMTDNFADRKKVFASSGIGRSPNLGASREPREPKHAGKAGGKSMWISWVASSDGIAVFNTAGSTFDTLLAVYTGGDLGSLTTVTRDEDQGGFLTSGAQFNAKAGTEYQIAVDAFAGREGIIILSWNLEPTQEVLPEIIVQPQSQTVGPGATVNLAIRSVAISIWSRAVAKQQRR